MAARGELEKAVVDVLWDAGEPMTARAVVDALPGRELAVTTVLTVLSRLEAKGLVRRSRDGRAHFYEATAGREEHLAALMRQVLDGAADRDAALTRIVGGISAQDQDALRRALDGPGQ
jgi:predicted transcriptional regulator